MRTKAVYGNQYTPNAKPSTQNVDILLQGNVSIQPVGNRYKLTAPINHNSGEDIVGQNEPVFMAIYKGDRSNYGIKGARLVLVQRVVDLLNSMSDYIRQLITEYDGVDYKDFVAYVYGFLTKKSSNVRVKVRINI